MIELMKRQGKFEHHYGVGVTMGGFGNGSVRAGGMQLENGYVIRVHCTYMKAKLQQLRMDRFETCFPSKNFPVSLIERRLHRSRREKSEEIPSIRREGTEL
jgi:hypothetical protein